MNVCDIHFCPTQQSSSRTQEISNAIQSRTLSSVAHRSAAIPDLGFLIALVRVYHHHIHWLKVFSSVEDVRAFVSVPGPAVGKKLHLT